MIKRINNDKGNVEFPFNNVSFYLKYLVHINFIDIYDEDLEEYNNLLIKFSKNCSNHTIAMKIINYTISKMKVITVGDKYKYFETCLNRNLEIVLNNG